MTHDGEDPLFDAPADDVDGMREMLDARAAHGLLRQLRDDADARSRRIEQILAGCEEPRSTARRWWLIAAASIAVLIVSGAFWMPRTDESVLDAAIVELDTPVDRRVDVTVTRIVRGEKRGRVRRHEVTFRPGEGIRSHFVGRFDSGLFGSVEVGSEGGNIWWRSLDEPDQFGEFPPSSRRRLADIVPLGVFDVRRLVRALRRTRDVEIERSVIEGRRIIRARVPALRQVGFGGIRNVDAVIDVDSRKLRSLEFTAKGPGGVAALRFSLQLGDVVSVDPDIYRRPW